MAAPRLRGRGGIFLLPNLFTTGALFCGFYAVIAGNEGGLLFWFCRCVSSPWSFDGLDGQSGAADQH